MASAPHQPKETPPYVLGHSPEELERLIRQSAHYNHTTEQVLEKAGIRTGMTVLDVGCGAGDVAFCAAQLVGPKGKVVAIDQSPDALALAEYRASEMGYENIEFIQADLNAYLPESPVDAVVGRLVLLYQKDPVATLAHLKKGLKNDGVLAIQEFNMMAVRSWPSLPLFDRHAQIITDVFTKAGMDAMLGCRLFYHFQEAGLKNVQVAPHIDYLLGEDIRHGAAYLVGTIRSLLPAARQLGVELPEDMDLDTLPERLYETALKEQTAFNTPTIIGVYGTL